MVKEKIELYKVIEVRMEKLEKLELEILGEKTIKTRKDWKKLKKTDRAT